MVLKNSIRGTSGRFSERMLSCNPLKILDTNLSVTARDSGYPARIRVFQHHRPILPMPLEIGEALVLQRFHHVNLINRFWHTMRV